MKKIIIILMFVILILGVFITANIVNSAKQKGITIYEIRDKIIEEKLDCSKGCDFHIEKVGEKYEIISVKNKITKDIIYESNLK